MVAFDDVVAAFRRLPAQQLVVLGGPGAGKSVLALLLTLGLLADRRTGDPVPVLLSPGSWNPVREHVHQWIAAQLLENYPGLANTARYGDDATTSLVLQGMVVPVLDGLDEIPPGLHAVAVDAIDRVMTGRSPFVVTCRTDEYERVVSVTGAMLTRAVVMEIEPVDAEAAIAFLTARARTGEDRWTPVVEHLRQDPDGPLAQVLRTPLMVDLVRTTYRPPDTSPAELGDSARFGSVQAIEEHLLDGFVAAAYAHHPNPPAQLSRVRARKGYDPPQALGWLIFLAHHLHRRQARDVAWWHLEQAGPRHIAAHCLSLPIALLFAVTGWLAGGPITGLLFGLPLAVAGIDMAVPRSPQVRR